MNVTLGSVLGVAAGLIAGGVAGGSYGWFTRGKRSAYFLAGSAAALIAGVALVYFGYVWSADWVSGFGVGVMGGGLTGVKYGEGMPSLWRGDGSDRGNGHQL